MNDAINMLCLFIGLAGLAAIGRWFTERLRANEARRLLRVARERWETWQGAYHEEAARLREARALCDVLAVQTGRANGEAAHWRSLFEEERRARQLCIQEEREACAQAADDADDGTAVSIQTSAQAAAAIRARGAPPLQDSRRAIVALLATRAEPVEESVLSGFQGRSAWRRP